MLNATERFRKQIGTPTRWATVVEYTNDGVTWAPLQLQDGTVTRSLSQQIHWQCDITAREDQGVNCTNTRLRIKHGIVYAPGDVELIPFGYYRVSSVVPDPDTKTMTIRGESYESFIIRHRLGSPKRYRSDSAEGTLNLIIREVFYEDLFARWLPGVDKNTHLPAIQAERDRWALVDGKADDPSIANAVGGRVIADPSGGFIVMPVPTLADAPVFTVAAGNGGVLISRAVTQTTDGVANMMCVRGESTEGIVTATARVADDDPNSPTYFRRKPSEGGFGTVPMFYASPLLTTYAQAERTGKAMLAQRLGLQLSITFESLHHPLLEPGDVVLIETPGEPALRAILDAVTYSLRGGPLQTETRTTRSSLAGQVVTISDTDVEGLE